MQFLYGFYTVSRRYRCRVRNWSGRQDLNLRPLHPQSCRYNSEVVDVIEKAGVSA